MPDKIGFIRGCYYFGVVADLLASLPLLFPEIARAMFGLQNFTPDNEYLYVSRIAASLMLGWTFLLLWGSFKPVERKGILLLTVFPVLTGLAISSVLAFTSGLAEVQYIFPLWVFYSIIIPLYLSAFILATRISNKKFS